MKRFIFCLCSFAFLFLTGCESNRTIVNSIDERQANEIVVFLSSYGIAAQKLPSTSSSGAGSGPSNLWNIAVGPTQTTEAMAILNRVGLPRRQGTSLLDMFAQTGLMSSDKQETIRYQTGLEKDLENMIRQIDGVVDSVVKLSFPEEQGIGMEATAKEKPRAAVFVKHEGVVDNPNSHLVTKIKRLVASSVTELTFDNVTVVSDRSRFTDVSPQGDSLSSLPEQQMATLWSITMSENSVSRFRTLFFTLSLLIVVFAGLSGFVIWKLYPFLPNGGLKKLFSLKSLSAPQAKVEEEPTPPVE